MRAILLQLSQAEAEVPRDAGKAVELPLDTMDPIGGFAVRAGHADPTQRELGCASVSLALQKPESIAAATAANIPKTLVVLLATDKHTGVRAEAAGALR